MMSNQDEIDADEIYVYICDIEDDLKRYEKSYFLPNGVTMHTDGEGIAAISAVLLSLGLFAGGLIAGQPLGGIAVLVASIAVYLLQVRTKILWDNRGIEAIKDFEAYKRRGGDRAERAKDNYLKTVVIGRIEQASLNKSVTRTYLFSALCTLVLLVAQLSAALAAEGPLWDVTFLACSILGLLGALYHATKVYLIHRNARLLDVGKAQ